IENKTPLETIKLIIESKNLILQDHDGVYVVKTKEEQDAEPTESAYYTFSYATAEKIAPLLTAQLQSKIAPQFDPRTNTIFYREARSNLEKIALFLETIDRPTQQVMIEARLVEVTANPRQSYGINWAGVVGGSSTPQTFRYGGSAPRPTDPTQGYPAPSNAGLQTSNGPITAVKTNLDNGTFSPFDMLLGAPGTANALS